MYTTMGVVEVPNITQNSSRKYFTYFSQHERVTKPAQLSNQFSIVTGDLRRLNHPSYVDNKIFVYFKRISRPPGPCHFPRFGVDIL